MTTASAALAMLRDGGEYAARLWHEVRTEIESQPDRYATVDQWSDLGTVCDENEFYAIVDEQLDIGYPGMDGDRAQFDAYCARANAAADAVTAMLSVCRRADPDERLGYDVALGGTVLLAMLPIGVAK